MALTRDRSEAAVQAPEPRRRGGCRVVLILAIALLLLAFGWTFLRPVDQRPDARPRLVHVALQPDDERRPRVDRGDWGPFSMFGGGYRVTVPLFGSILQRVAGIDLYTFSAFMMVGVPVLTGLALGGVLLAHAPRPAAVPPRDALDRGAVHDDALRRLPGQHHGPVLPVVDPRVLPGPNVVGRAGALFLFGVAAAFTHPTTCVIFGFSLMAFFGLRVLTSRFHLGPPLKELGLAHGDGLRDDLRPRDRLARRAVALPARSPTPRCLRRTRRTCS